MKMLKPIRQLLKVIFLIGMMGMSWGMVTAQVPEWQWARSASCTGGTEGLDVASDASGNVYVMGWYTGPSISFGSITLYSQNPNRYYAYLAKYDSSGNVLWAKKAGGTGISLGSGVAVDFAGNAYITGLYDSSYVFFGNDTLSYNGTNIFLTKYDSSGNVLWAKCAGGVSVNASSTSVATDPFGNVYITGFFHSSNLIIGSDTLTNYGNYNVFTAKYDSSGNALWAKSGQGTTYDLSYSVASDASGNAYITGYFASPFIVFDTDTLFNPNLFYTIFLVKYDPSGNVTLAKSSIGGGGNYGTCVTTSSSGNIYITGHFNSYPIIFGSDTLLPSGNVKDAYLVKYDFSGNVLWAKCFWGALPYKIIVDAADNIYMTSSMGYPTNVPIAIDSITLQLPPGSTDPMFVAKFNSSGNVCWAKALASGGDDHSGVALGPTGSIYITSDFYNINPFILGCDTLTLTGYEDIFVVKLGDIMNFSSTDTTFCEKHCIDFFDLSSNNPTSWQWFFPGADSTSSILQNPTNICYNNYGSFDVTLIACGCAGCDTLVLPGFINVYQTLTPTITQSNDTLFSSAGVAYQWWSVDSGIITGANNSYYIPTQGGSYYVIVTDTNGCDGASNTIIITLVNEWSAVSGQLSTIPNPNEGNFTVSINDIVRKDFSLRIINAIGQTVYKGQEAIGKKQEAIVNLGNTAKGFYVVEVINDGKVYRGRFIKE